MPDLADDAYAQWQLAKQRQRDEYAASIGEDGAAQSAAVDVWAQNAPTAPAGVITSFAQSGITPDSQMGQWLLKQGLPQLGSMQVIPDAPNRMTQGQAASQLLGNPDLLQYMSKNMSVDDLTNVFQKSTPADIGQWVDNQDKLNRLLEGKSAEHHQSFWEHVGHVAGYVTRPVGAGLAAGYEGLQGAARRSIGAELQIFDDLKNRDFGDAAGDIEHAALATGATGSPLAAPTSPVFTDVKQHEYKLPVTGAKINIGPNVNNPASQTTAYQAIVEGKSLGQGLFPAGPAAEAQAEAARRSATVNNHALTPGRALAANVVEPGTVPYSILSGAIDATTAIKADPGSAFLQGFSDVRAANKVFAAANTEEVAHAAADHLLTHSPGNLAKIRTWAAVGAEHDPGVGLKNLIVDKITRDPGSISELVDNGIIDRKTMQTAILGQKAGLIQGTRFMVHPPTALTWLNSKPGQTFVNWAGKSGFNEIWTKTKGKIPAAFVAKLAETSDPEEVRRLMAGAIGTDVREAPGRLAAYTWSRPQNSRMLNYLPRGSVSADNVNNAVDQIRRLMIATKVPKDQWDDILSKVATSTNQAEMYDSVVNGAYKAIEDATVQNIMQGNTSLVGNAVSHIPFAHPVDEADARDLAHTLTRAWSDKWQSDSQFFINATGDTPHMPGMLIGGDQEVPIVGPHLPTELLNRNIPLLNAKDIQNNIGTWGRAWRAPVIGSSLKGAEAAAASLTGVFKASTLLALKLPVRFLADEQARMATAGMDSMFKHPLSYIAYVAGRKGEGDILGERFVDELADAQSDYTRAIGSMAHKSSSIWSPDMVFGKHYEPISIDDSRYLDALWDQHSKLHMDPVARNVARAILDDTYVPTGIDEATHAALGNPGGMDAVNEWFQTGKGARYRMDLAQANLWKGESAYLANDRAAAQSYLDSVKNRILETTAGDQDAIKAIADGTPFRAKMQLGDLKRDLAKAKKAGDLTKVTDLEDRILSAQEYRSKLATMRASGNAPDFVMGPARQGAFGNPRILRNITDRLFNALMDTPTGKLTRHPGFTQAYWKRIDELQPFMDDAALSAARKEAERQGISLSQVEKGTGEVGAHQADTLAKGHALHSVKDVLYYPNERMGVTEKLRYIAPFGEAWRNVLSTWAKLSYENPVVFRRLQQGVVASRQSGWWFKDPMDGVEKFTLAPAALVEKFTGVPFPMVAPVKGLNIVGQGLPGVGPALQFTAAGLMKAFNVPAEDFLRKNILPYGDPEYTQGGGLFESLFPGWADKLRTGGWFVRAGLGEAPSADQRRLLDNTIHDVMQYKLSSGTWDLSNPDDMLRLEKESTHDAKMLYLLRGLSQFGVPAAPSFSPQTKLKDGGLMETWLLGKDYDAMVAQNNGDQQAATMEFVQKYGPQRIFAVQPHSQTMIFGIPTSAEATAFKQQHGDFAKKFPTVYGYWVPQGQGPFDYSEYLQQIADGVRKPLSPDEWLKLAEARLGNAAYDNLRRRLPATTDDAQKAWLAANKAGLQQQFPGFNDDSVYASRKTLPQQIDELKSAVRDKTVSGTPLAHAVTVYLELRDRALAEAKARGYSTMSSDAVGDLRDWLYSNGRTIANQIPEFVTIWNNLLSDEVKSNA